jgi:hypothetical protein
MLNEVQIKSALIDFLFHKGFLKDAVLINELPVANWSRRADIAVANGKLYAFEIKSDFDTLKRLDAQVTTYLDRFDKVTVVTTPKYASLVVKDMPKQVEIWVAKETSTGVSFAVARRGQLSLVKNRRILAAFLHKSEIAHFLRQNGIAASPESSREDLAAPTDQLSVNKLRSFVLAAMKKRYGKQYNHFLSARAGVTRPEDLKAMSRFPRRVEVINPVPPIEEVGNCRFLDMKMLEDMYGPLPPGTPCFVLKRRKTA